jgi:alpha-1,2-mannosyltransferase
MPTTFAGVLLLGGGLDAARLLQKVVSGIAGLAVFWVWRQGPPLPLKAAALALGALLATPFAFDYDLTLLAIPLACLGWQGFREGCRPVQEIMLIIVYLTPFLAPAAANYLHLPLAPLVLMAVLGLVVVLVRQEAGSVMAAKE